LILNEQFLQICILFLACARGVISRCQDVKVSYTDVFKFVVIIQPKGRFTYFFNILNDFPFTALFTHTFTFFLVQTTINAPKSTNYYKVKKVFPSNIDPLSIQSIADFCNVDSDHIFYMDPIENGKTKLEDKYNR
jgi:hypothetical protein